MKRLLPVSLLLLTGCAVTGNTTQSPKFARAGSPASFITTPAAVWIAGDSLVGAWATPQVHQQNPTWEFFPPPTDAQGQTAAVDETSGALLTRIQTLLAATPAASLPQDLV